jgi:hypothetical protein
MTVSLSGMMDACFIGDPLEKTHRANVAGDGVGSREIGL